MAKRSPRTPIPSGPPPLIVTNPAAAVTRLRNRLLDVGKLDPEAPDDPRFEALEQTIRSNIQEIFGEESQEYTNHWHLEISFSNEPNYLRADFDDDDGFYGSRNSSKAVQRRRDGIARTKVKLESLISQIEERIAENASAVFDQQEEDGMGSPIDSLGNDRITLIKPDGQVAMSGVKAVVQATSILVSRAVFPVEDGDEILRAMPAGMPPDRYQVLSAHYLNAGHGLSHWEISVRKISARPAPAAAPAPTAHVTHNHTYHVNQAAAVGPGATATENTLVQHNTQQTWNATDLSQLAQDLTALRKALLVEAAENEEDLDATEEAGKVAQAQKAIKAGVQSDILVAMKGLGAKAWAVAERLGLAYVNAKLREKIGLPPGDSA